MKVFSLAVMRPVQDGVDHEGHPYFRHMSEHEPMLFESLEDVQEFIVDRFNVIFTDWDTLIPGRWRFAWQNHIKDDNTYLAVWSTDVHMSKAK